MTLERIVARTWDENILFSVLLELTFACDLNCFYCYNDLGSSGEPLNLEEYEDLLGELAELQVMQLTLSGGEPLANHHFFDIGSCARELGFVVRIKSNGHALNEVLARRLRSEVDPFLHDRQTRVTGSFQRLLRNVETMVDIGLRCKLNCTLTRWNEDEIEDLFALADRLGVKLVINSTMTPRDNGDLTPLELVATDDGIRRLHQQYRRRAGGEEARSECRELPSVSKICGAGSSTIAVDPFGEVFPCVQWRRSLGNVRSFSIHEIWDQSPVLQDVRRLSQAAKIKMDGLGEADRDTFHCLGLSEELTGDPLETDPVSRRNGEILRAVRAEEDGGKAGKAPPVDRPASQTDRLRELRSRKKEAHLDRRVLG